MGIESEDNGLVALGGELSISNLIAAYRHGVFPWPMSPNTEDPIPWFCPPERGILEFANLRIPRSLRAARTRAGRPTEQRPAWSYSTDRAFTDVITNCARAYRPGQPGTWITPPLLDAYVALHRAGHAHSAEIWEGSVLIGGLYGVEIDGAFAGESMFHLRPNASKLALLYLVDVLRERGAEWMDIQMVTPHLAQLGATAIARTEFLRKLARTHERGLRLFSEA